MEATNDIPDYVPPGEPKKWFHSGWMSRSFLLVAGLFFLLPFINIKCSGTTLASVKGIDLITGSEIKPAENKDLVPEEDTTSMELADQNDNSLFKPKMADSLFEKGDDKRIAPNAIGITSFASLILGLLFSFFPKRVPVIISGGFCLLGALCLFFIQIQVNNEVETKLGPFNFAPITFEFTPYYWGSVLLMAVAAVFSFVRSSALKNN